MSPGPELAGGQASPDSHLQLAPRKPRGETAFVQSAALHIPADGRLTRWVFLRGLGLVWLAAFLSLWSQIMGLLGTEGVARAAQRLGDIGHFWETGAEGFPWWRLPTLSWWWGAGDGALDWMCGAGTALSVLLIAGVAPAAMLAGLFALYLSLVHLSAGFLAYQWDALLLEVTFVAMFHAPLCLVDRLASPTPPARWTTLLLRLVLFKVMFMSGGAKLASGDAVWRDLTALDYHFWTQPLPHVLSWFTAQLPGWALQGACAVMLAIELVLPFGLLLSNPRARLVAALGTAALMLAIGLTGNYGFFNLT